MSTAPKNEPWFRKQWAVIPFVVFLFVLAIFSVISTSLSNQRQENIVAAQAQCNQEFKEAITRRADITIRDNALRDRVEQSNTNLILGIATELNSDQPDQVKLTALFDTFREESVQIGMDRQELVQERLENPLPSIQCS